MRAIRTGAIAASGETIPDPLAGYPWIARMQTHNGNGTPLGLYTDMAGTTPVVTDGDVALNWTDELSTSGAVFSNTTNGIIVKFVNGIPVLRSDSTGNSLVGSPYMIPVSFFALVKRNDSPWFGRIINTVSGVSGLNLEALATGRWDASFANAVITDIGPVTGGYDIIEAQGSPGASYVAVNGVETSLSDQTFYPFGLPYTIGDYLSGGNQNPKADIVAILISGTPIASPDRVIIRNYLATLRPL